MSLDALGDDESLAWLLELRVRVRGRPEALAIVDRCIALLARAAASEGEAEDELQHEFDRIADALAVRFGAPRGAPIQ